MNEFVSKKVVLPKPQQFRQPCIYKAAVQVSPWDTSHDRVSTLLVLTIIITMSFIISVMWVTSSGPEDLRLFCSVELRYLRMCYSTYNYMQASARQTTAEVRVINLSTHIYNIVK